MKLTCFEIDTPVGTRRCVGVLDGDSFVDVTAANTYRAEQNDEPPEVARTETPPSMLEFLRRGETAMEAAREAVEYSPEDDTRTGEGARLRYGVDEVRLLSPLPRPNSLRDFMVFEEHVRNTSGEPPDVWYDQPIYYKGNPDSVYAPGETVDWPGYTDSLDYELEIAAVVGRKGRDVPREEAMDYIAGYMVFNDWSARDVQMEEMQAMLGPAKGKDFANSFGPYLVTPDEFDVEGAAMEARVNGETWSEGSVGEMHHSFDDIVEHVSDSETIHPGDVLGSGTVGGGCGLELGRFLDPGDTVELEVEGLGVLRNTVGEKE